MCFFCWFILYPREIMESGRTERLLAKVPGDHLDFLDGVKEGDRAFGERLGCRIFLVADCIITMYKISATASFQRARITTLLFKFLAPN